MTNQLITPETNREALIEEYKNYPSVMPDGAENYPFSRARVVPIVCEIPDGAKVLDVGANDGEFIRLLKEKKKCDVFGVDISNVALEKAKAKGLNVQWADGESLPFPDGTFDVVCLMEVLSHVHNPRNVLRETRRVLKKNGFLIGSAPHANIELHMWEEKFSHRRYYTDEELRQELLSVFPKVHMRILTGAQFSPLGLSDSHLAVKPAEMLFKCGRKRTLPWDAALLDRSVLRTWMSFSLPGGVVYYRMRGFADKMREAGHEIAYEHFEYDPQESHVQWQGRVRNTILQNQIDQLLRVADVSIWQIVGNRDCIALLKCAKDVIKKPIITELDDWIFDLPSYNLAANPYRPNSESEWIAMEQLKVSDGFICSTEYIKEKLNEMFPEKPIYVIPNSLDFDIWDRLNPPVPGLVKNPGVVRIGYTGCANHNRDMDILIRPLLKLLEEYENLEFVYAHPLTSIEKLNHPRIKCLNRWVTIDKYPHEFAGWNIDIGVAPLRDNAFNRAKSNLRWLEFSAIKVPAVCSGVYPFLKSIKHGEDGLICYGESEWYEALKSLIVDEGERTRMGNQAYTRVKRDFNMTETAKRYAEVLNEIKCSGARSKKKLVAC